MGPPLAGLDGNGLQTWRGDKYRPKDLRDKIEKDFKSRDCLKNGLFDMVLSKNAGHNGILVFQCTKKGCEKEVGIGNPDMVRERVFLLMITHFDWTIQAYIKHVESCKALKMERERLAARQAPLASGSTVSSPCP